MVPKLSVLLSALPMTSITSSDVDREMNWVREFIVTSESTLCQVCKLCQMCRCHLVKMCDQSATRHKFCVCADAQTQSMEVNYVKKLLTKAEV